MVRIIDLTLPVNRNMTGIPRRREYLDNPTRCVVFSSLSEGQAAGLRKEGLEVSVNCQISHHMMSRVEMVTHIGTHIDAPCHFLEDGLSVDRVPLDFTVRPGRVIPLTHLLSGSAVTADDILATGVDFDVTTIPVLHTGWTDRAWGTDRFWNEMIYLDTSAALLLVERDVRAVALDFFPEAPSWLGIEPEAPPGRNHRTLLGNETILIQMLTNVGAIDTKDFLLVGAPLRLEGLDGSPARVFAITN
jgi:kynurenine formamidase